MMAVGGGWSGGIHGAHMAPGVHMRYAAADRKRQTIPWVEYRNDRTGGVSRQYLSSDAKPGSVASLPQFDMQCVDCHNRPTHSFELPERALDRAMATGNPSHRPPIPQKDKHGSFESGI
ncbi:MAG: hypothetical protein M3Y27_06555 [Acidobacteriota bacterium]|nr:hypothetical protein [Acidobacteriota bacterium]